jgi:hypothetical protein
MGPGFAIRGVSRYPISMELQYTTRERVRRVGMGRTQFISSRDVVFVTDQPMESGTKVEISISWPVLLHEKVPLKLVLEAEVTGRQETALTARIVKYQFRTRRVPAASESANAVVTPRRAAAPLYENQAALYAR